MKVIAAFLIGIFMFCSCNSNQDEERNPLQLGFTVKRTTDIDALDLSGVTHIEGGVHILFTESSDLEFLSNVKSIGENLIIFANQNLTSLEGLRSLERVKSIEISNNYNLKNLDILEDLIIEENLKISKNIVSDLPLIGTTSLKNLTIDEPEIKHVDFLQNILEIRGELAIVNSDSLKNLDGLSNLITIGSEVHIENNGSLIDFCGLKQSLENSSLRKFEIKGNARNPSRVDIVNECD